MRIVVVNWTARKVGGIESYLTSLIPLLKKTGHDVEFVAEADVPASRDSVLSPPNQCLGVVTHLGADAVLARIQEYKPSAVYVHGAVSPSFERKVQRVAPAVYFAHAYDGLCISGLKTFKFPVVKPCYRRFDWKCLLHYFPHRCGGKNPLTMIRLYRTALQREHNLRRYRAIVTYSEHMRRECIKQGIAPERVHPFAGPTRVEQVGEPVPSTTPRFKERRLIFAGRMDFVKGPSFLLDAIPSVASQIRDPIVLVLAGDGPETARLDRKAKALTRRCQQVRIEFTGWLGQAELNHQLARADLLIVPSLWPEPYGLIGPQAARFGLPTVAYGSGAIPEWLF